MELTVNGQARELPDGTTVDGLLDALEVDPGGRSRGVAVAVDAEVVPRAQWPSRTLLGERVEVLTAIQGG